MTLLLLYVDDIILTSSSDSLRTSIISLLALEFSMKDLGPLSYFLGISVTRQPHSLFLQQTTYAKDIIEHAGRYSMSQCNPVHTPVDTSAKLSGTSGPPVANPTEYRSLARALQYLTFSRPDISYGVQQGTLSYDLYLYKSPNRHLIAYTDADWAGCPDTRRSTSGYCVYFGDNLISWSSKRQHILSRSSAEVEYRGIANVVSDSCWIRNLLLELHCPLPKCTLVFCDNVSAIFLSGNPVQHQ
ncbi:uncharacterized mitochondrial protein AtMg00810-like [Rutidosis leptorrhynchoides]|uniref:uncharacterized mitochondrial protein AtMg00810-like n=1 Tax=Rutidosis leptorrhynchoides TaxID=125765 RepID=UPI003A9901FF